MAISEVTPLVGYQGTCTIGGHSGRFTDLSFNPKTYTLIDVTSIADGGKKTYTKGCYEESISGTLQLDTTADFTAIKTACESRAAVQCAFSIGSGQGAISISGLMHPNFTGPMTLSPDAVVTVPFECKPCPTAGTADSNSNSTPSSP